MVKLFERLAPEGPEQISFYDPGVGTYSPLRNSLWHRIEAAVESASGSGVKDKVAEAYKYLMDNYEKDDKIFLFGYSRGAHTVRDLAGLLDTCGLLTRGSENLIPYALSFYYRWEEGNRGEVNRRRIARRFQSAFSRPCDVHFIGVWDTVASVGWLWWRKYFRYERLSGNVAYAYQALAVDERRAHFRPSRWDEESVPSELELELEQQRSRRQEQVIEQVWFPGYHGDLGGQNADQRISDISLLWMLKSAKKRGLHLNDKWLDGLNPDAVGGNLRRSDRHVYRLRTRPRVIDREGRFKPKIHESVLQRKRAVGCQYNPANLPLSYHTVPCDRVEAPRDQVELYGRGDPHS